MNIEQIMATVKMMASHIKVATMKPTVTVECIQFIPENIETIKMWLGHLLTVVTGNVGASVFLLNGQMLRDKDWIVVTEFQTIIMRDSEFTRLFDVKDEPKEAK